jgi:hypothetical protein
LITFKPAAQKGQRGVQRGFIAELVTTEGMENSCLADGREAVSGKCGNITKVYGLVK